MGMIDKLIMALVLWGFIIAVCNPFFKDRRMTMATVFLLATATVLWVLT